MSGERLTLERVDRVERTDATALEDVERVLEANGLPSADVRSSPARFYVARDGDERIGIGGLETRGTDGLLRSVVIEDSRRGEGLGTALCDALEARAKSAGVERLYLLTTTAEGFFAERGYVERERTDVPGSIRQTAEFDELCPTTATCLAKSL